MLLDPAVPGSLLFAKCLKCAGLFIPVLGASCPDLLSSLPEMFELGSSLLLQYAARSDLGLFVLRSVSSGFLPLSQGHSYFDSSSSPVGRSRLGSTASSPGCALLGVSVLVQSLAHPDLLLSLLDFVAMASSSPVKDFGHLGVPVPVLGKSWFGCATLLLDLLHLGSPTLVRALT